MNFPFFFMVLAWVGVVVGYTITFFTIRDKIDYENSETRQLLDRVRGVTTIHTPGRYMLVGVISTVYLITYYFG